MESFKRSIYGKVAEGLSNDLESGGFEAVGKKVLEAANIEPLYTLEQKDNQSFIESRERLNSEAGLIIANHPGYYDTFAILGALKRSDVKIVVGATNYETYKPVLGEEMLIRASADPADGLSMMRSIKEHVENGGVVIMYPSGGVDRADKENKSLNFQNGFSVIIKRCLKPDNMIYAFHIADEDVESIVEEKVSRIPGIVSAVAIDSALNINQLKERATIRVDERYSRAEEWQKVSESAERDNRNTALTEHFKNNFGI